MDSDVSGALSTSVLKVELRLVGGENADVSRGWRQQNFPAGWKSHTRQRGVVTQEQNGNRDAHIVAEQFPLFSKYVKKNQIVSSHKTQLMAKLSLFLSYNDMFRPTTTAIVRLYMKPF